MLPVTHLLAPMLLLMLYWARNDTPFAHRLLLFAGFAGVLPDLLNIHISLAERASWSYSALILAPLGIAVLLTDERLRRYLAVLWTGVAAHILLDIVSNPYNFLYPLQFDPVYPALGSCGINLPFACWYAFDAVLVIAFVLLSVRWRAYWPDPRAGGGAA